MTTARRSIAGDRTDIASLDRLLAAVSAQRMLEIVRTLAAERFAGRRVGTPGGLAARSWLVDGLSTVGGPVDVDEFTTTVTGLYAAALMRWSAADDAVGLTYRRDFVVHLTSADLPDPRRGGLATPDDDVSDRWIIVPPGVDWSPVKARASEAGALGMVVMAGVDAEGWMPAMLAAPPIGPVPVVAVSPAVHADLAVAAGQGTGWIEANTPLRPTVVQGANVHLRLRDAHAGATDILLTAHYDGVGDDPAQRLPGASDNATGVAVVWQAAEILGRALPAGVGLSLALLDGEEIGALGSARHAGQLVAQGRTPFVVNVDGAGRLHRAASVEAGGAAHPILMALDEAGRHVGLPLAGGAVASDNRRYAGAGLPAVGIGAGMPGYHTPADVVDSVDTATLDAVCRLVVGTGWLLATGE